MGPLMRAVHDLNISLQPTSLLLLGFGLTGRRAHFSPLSTVHPLKQFKNVAKDGKIKNQNMNGVDLTDQSYHSLTK